MKKQAPPNLTIAEVAALMQVDTPTARKRLAAASIVPTLGRSATNRLASLYPRAQVLALVREGPPTRGRPPKK